MKDKEGINRKRHYWSSVEIIAGLAVESLGHMTWTPGKKAISHFHRNVVSGLVLWSGGCAVCWRSGLDYLSRAGRQVWACSCSCNIQHPRWAFALDSITLTRQWLRLLGWNPHGSAIHRNQPGLFVFVSWSAWVTSPSLERMCVFSHSCVCVCVYYPGELKVRIPFTTLLNTCI